MVAGLAPDLVKADEGLRMELADELFPKRPVLPSTSVRGIHGSAGTAAPPRDKWEWWINELKAMGIKWYKQLDAGDPNDLGGTSTFEWCKLLKQSGIEPIVRFYKAQQFPGVLDDFMFEKMKLYARQNIVYAEIGNEPNLPNEWKVGSPDWNSEFIVSLIANNWLLDADRTLAAGMRPAFYAFAPTDWGSGRPHPTLSSVNFYRELVRVMGDRSAKEALALFRGGAWLAVHISPYEFEFDFDPYPNRTTPWDMCLRGYQIPLQYFQSLLAMTPEIISTEGGVFCMDSGSMGGHQRLSSHEEHADKTIKMFSWLQHKSPLKGMCPWLLCNDYDLIGHSDPSWNGDAWYRPEPLPVVHAMKATAE